MSQKHGATPKLDNKLEIHHPLDYSFKAISTFEDLLKEKHRPRDKNGILKFDEEITEENFEIVKSHSSALKVNNNLLTMWVDFSETINKLFVDPAQTLAWIDLSFNDLKIIDNVLLELPNLTMLYLHANNICSISQVDKLEALKKLKTLTLHGNPIEIMPGYRSYVVSTLQQLQKFDFSAITKVDRVTAGTWRTMIATKPPKRIKKSELN